PAVTYTDPSTFSKVTSRARKSCAAGEAKHGREPGSLGLPCTRGWVACRVPGCRQPSAHQPNVATEDPDMAVVTMRQLLESGVHFGHQTRRWNPKMKRFIFTERNGIYIIDLQQSLTYIDRAF